jgi:hypothetical protein
MSNFVFNIAKGRVNELAKLPAANDALIGVLLQTTGLESDATLMDYADLGALLAASNDEQTVMGRKTLASVTVTPDNTNDRQEADAADPTWSGATGNPVSKLLICYDGDTTSGTDSNIIPLCAYDWSVTPNGSDVTAVLNAAGFYRAS